MISFILKCSCQEDWRTYLEMKKPFTRVIILIILSALLIALPVEIIGLFRNQQAFEIEAEDKTEYAIRSAGTDLDMVFNSMSNLINMLHSTVQVTFSGKKKSH